MTMYEETVQRAVSGIHWEGVIQMSVKIGSARIDENGRARGGKAGDQTGKEVKSYATE